MSIEDVPAKVRQEEYFHHIDMGFLNRRLCLSALPRDVRSNYIHHAKPGSDHMTVLGNDHLLVTMLLDVCDALGAPTLSEALGTSRSKCMFRSTERLAPCPGVYSEPRVTQDVVIELEVGRPVQVAYHTEHIVSSTGRMTLSKGSDGNYVHSIVGLLHEKGERFEIEPLVMGAP